MTRAADLALIQYAEGLCLLDPDETARLCLLARAGLDAVCPICCRPPNEQAGCRLPFCQSEPAPTVALACAHEFVSAVNEVIRDGYWCPKCGALSRDGKVAIAPTVAPAVPKDQSRIYAGLTRIGPSQEGATDSDAAPAVPPDVAGLHNGECDCGAEPIMRPHHHSPTCRGWFFHEERAALAAANARIELLVGTIEQMRTAAQIDDWDMFDAAIAASKGENQASRIGP